VKQPENNLDQAPPSRTRRKKEDQARKAIGEALVTLGAEQMAGIDLPTELRAAVQLARQTRQHGARRRQIQYIGTLLRHMDTAPIRQALENIRRGDIEKAQAFKRIEAWRDALLDGNNDMVEEILADCPGADRQQLRQLARNAAREAREGRGPSAARKLFRYLVSIQK
jgi:ribosome-associated protein